MNSIDLDGVFQALVQTAGFGVLLWWGATRYLPKRDNEEREDRQRANELHRAEREILRQECRSEREAVLSKFSDELRSMREDRAEDRRLFGELVSMIRSEAASDRGELRATSERLHQRISDLADAMRPRG